MSDAPRRMVWLRHGQTAWNLQGRAQGHADVPLDDVGAAQAAAVAPYVAAYAPSVLVSSDLARAVQTASSVAAACGLPVETDPGLREFALDEARVGLTLAEYAAQHPEAHAAIAAGRIEDVPGREQVADMLGRFLPVVRALVDRLGRGECGVLVSHGAAMRRSLGAFLDWPDGVTETITGFGNCAFAVVEESASTWAPVEHRWRLAAYNLGPAATPGPDFVNADEGR